jgi:hypothetical protein
MLIFQRTKSYSNLHMNDVPCQQHISKFLYQNFTLIMHNTPKPISEISPLYRASVEKTTIVPSICTHFHKSPQQP